jgi:hypothetical protein
MALKIAAFAPPPIERVAMTVAVKPGARRRVRIAY